MTGSTEENTFYFYRGRVALYALLRALDVGPGDEVLLQAFTCLAVPAPVVALGARPVYLDIDPKSFCMDPQGLESQITGRSKAVVVQHTFGNSAEMGLITAITRKRNLPVIEDCCHALGTMYKGRQLGCIGDAAFYSYEWGKPVVIGLGGTAVVHSPDLLKRVDSLYAMFKPPPLRDVITVHLLYLAHSVLMRSTLFWTIRDAYRFLSGKGLVVGTFRHEEFEGLAGDEYGRRMARSFQRRLRLKLRRLQADIAHRKWVAAQYENGLRRLGLECVTPPQGANVVYLRYPILVREKTRILQEARKRGIELGDWYASPVHPLTEDQWVKVGYQKGSCPVAEEAARRVVTLPIYARIGQKEIDRTLGFLSDLRARGLL